MGTGAIAARPQPRLPAVVRLTRGLAMPVVSVLFAFLVGALIVLVTGANPIDAYTSLLCGGIGIGCTQGENSALQISNTIVFTIPLITAGIAVALPFRAGLFNIGAEGQLLAGSIACTAIGVRFADWPAAVLLPAVLLGGMAAGALWAGVAGVLKATVGAHEVVTTIMMNYVAQWFLRYLIVGGPLELASGTSKSHPIGAGAQQDPPRIEDRPAHRALQLGVRALR
jgi:simple sugar transport system permease protein